MYAIAIQMLLGDKVKYLMLLTALAFSTLLMTQQGAIFWGTMKSTTALLRNTKVPIWIVDPNVEQLDHMKPLKDTDLYRVRSVKGISWALPFYFNDLQAKLYNGDFEIIRLIGVDQTTLLGIPNKILKGRVEDLRKSDGIIIDQKGIIKLSKNLKKPLDIGDVFDINDHEVRIVGIVKTEESLFSNPLIYTTYNRAVEISPPIRRTLSAILVKPESAANTKELVKNIKDQTGLNAYTEDIFFWKTIWWLFKNTAIPTSFGITVFLGFVVGIVVTGQTFFSFINENLRDLGALKAMGTSDDTIHKMLLIQACVVGFIGYGIGLGLSSLFGILALSQLDLPYYASWQIPLATLIMILAICLFSAYLGIRKVSKYEAAEVFRG